MARTPIDICNKALDLLGQKADVGNIETPSTENEQICARWYYDTLDYLLRQYVWNFAVIRKEIPRDVQGTPAFDFTDAYKIPNDFIRLLAINGREDFNRLNFDDANGYILLNNDGASSIELKYIARITDVTKYDSGFVKLLTLHLAVNMAYRFTQKQTTIERLLGWIEREEAKVVSIDGQERPPKRIQTSKYIRARRRASYDRVDYSRPVKFVSTEDDNASG